MTYTIGNTQRKTRYAETPDGVKQIPAMGEITADLDADGVKRLLSQGFKLNAPRSSAPTPAPVAAPVIPKVETMNVVDSGGLGAINAGKLKKPSKATKADDSTLDSIPGVPGQES